MPPMRRGEHEEDESPFEVREHDAIIEIESELTAMFTERCFLPLPFPLPFALPPAAAFPLPAAAPPAAPAPTPAFAPPPAAAPPWVTRTQLPKPALVVIATRHWFPPAPPVHLVPAGREAETWEVVTLAGAGSPFFVIVTVPAKLLPVAVVSTVADLMAVAPSAPLYD